MNDLKCGLFSDALLGESYTKTTHPSGLEIYVFPKKMSAAYAMLGTRYGSINNTFRPCGESESVTVPDGIAHFLEHKLFFNEDGSDSFEKFSALGADANAYTSFDKTVYLFSCTDRFYDSLSELVTFVTHPFFTDESVAKEIGIIAEEIKMYDDTPSDRCYYGMLEGMYKSHSVKRNICGSVESIKRITPSLLYDCYNVFYRLDNMALVICGDVDADKVMSVIDPLLPRSISGEPTVCANENEHEPRESTKKYVSQRMQVSKPLFSIGFKDTDIPVTPRERLKKEAVISILDDMLFSKSAELYCSLFERQIVSPSLSFGYTICQSFAFNSIGGEADDPNLALEEILAYVDKIRDEGFDKKDFERTKKVLYSEWIRSFDSPEEIANTLFGFACDGIDIFEYTDVISSVTLEDVNRALSSCFDRDTMTLSVIRPLNNDSEDRI